MNINEITQTIYNGAMLIGVIVIVYKTFTKPAQKNETSIGIMEVACKLKHDALDKALNETNKTLAFFRENDLKHIEETMNALSNNQTKIFTILEERLPRK